MKKNLLLLLPVLPATLAAQGRYNIVYIMTDDHTAQMMSCYDNRYVQTPNLDRIAADGVKFVNSFVANSLSGPSRACMLTGKHSHKNGFTNNEHGVFDGTQQTMPKLLRAAGYQTAIIGKWHLVTTPTGFDYWNIVPGQGDYYNPDFIKMDQSTVREHGYVTDIITDKSIDWMENKRDKSRPFILFIHHKACHRNWLPEMKYLHEYEDVTFPIPETFYDDYAGRPAAKAQEMEIGKDMDLTYDTKIYRWDKLSWLHIDITGAGNISWKAHDEFSPTSNVLRNVYYSVQTNFFPTKKLQAYWPSSFGNHSRLLLVTILCLFG